MTMKTTIAMLLGTCLLLWGCDTKTKNVDSCGDGFIDPGEECDGVVGEASCASLGFYNTLGTLGCRQDCTFEDSECGGRCGDNLIDSNHDEDCDGSNLAGNTCQTFGYPGGVLACTSNCQWDFSSCESQCGNGKLEGDEACDDQNLNPDDGCSEQCTIESGWECAQGNPSVCSIDCGDGLIMDPEECDTDNLDQQTCTTLGFRAGSLQCGEDCRFDVTGCGGRCGDGLIQGNYGEVCDGENLNGLTCEASDFTFGQLSCDELCLQNLDDCLSISSISSGGYHSCALLENGTLRCWGKNQFGQLGDGTNNSVNHPVMVTGLSDVLSVSSGNDYTCAVLADHTVRCWGWNAFGQLGDGTTTDRRTPVNVIGLSGVSQVTCGTDHTCAVLLDGTARCWGQNNHGQLGDGTNLRSQTPVVVNNLINVVSISTGMDHTCALLDDHTVWCWGSNNFGQLGDGTFEDRNSPVNVVSISGAYQVTVGTSFSCALLGPEAGIDSGTVHCWGANGSLGDGTTTNSSLPVRVLSVINASDVSSGSGHTCAIVNGNNIFCWGSNFYGQLGDGTTTDRLIPVQIGQAWNWSRVEAGYRHTCMITYENRRVKCTGTNLYGQLGDGTNTARVEPVDVLSSP